VRERGLLARRLRVEVDEHDRRQGAGLLDERVHDLPRRLRRVEEEVAEQAQHRHAHAVARLDDGEAAPRREDALVGGADHALARGEVVADAAAPVGVVAERDDVGARGEELVGELPGDARAVGGVLAVDDADVHVELLAQPRKVVLDGAPAGHPEDVGEEEDLQLRASCTAGRSSTETWSPASFV